MGIFDFLGGSGPDKALKLKSKVTQKYGDPSTRQKALQQLGEMKFPEAVSVLLQRYNITVEPLTTDTDEKEHVFELIKGFGQDAVGPVTEFLRKNEAATSWALRILEALLPQSEVTVKVPPGSQSGRRMRLKGRGAPSLKGGGTGDFYLVLQVKVPEPATPAAKAAAEALARAYSGDVRQELKL